MALALVGATACGDDAGSGTYAGIVRDPAPVVAGVALPDATTNAPVAFRAAPDGLLLVYFGYLSCPDVCPTTMADLRTALGKLRGAERDRVQVVMATIDPGRDTGQALQSYVSAFVTGARGVRTDDPAALRAAADALGADYQVRTSATGSIEVSHTGFVYVIDDDGRLQLTWPFGIDAAAMQRDLRLLLSRVDDAA